MKVSSVDEASRLAVNACKGCKQFEISILAKVLTALLNGVFSLGHSEEVRGNRRFQERATILIPVFLVCRLLRAGSMGPGSLFRSVAGKLRHKLLRVMLHKVLVPHNRFN